MNRPLAMRRPAALALLIFFALLMWCSASTAQAQGCVAPSPKPVPVKIVKIRNNATIPIYVVLETAKQDLLDDHDPPRRHDRWLQAEFNPVQSGGADGTYASTYVYRTYINPQNGIRRGDTVSVTVPFYTQLEASPCPFNDDQYINWWRALRIYVYDDPGAIKQAYAKDTNPNNTTVIANPPGTLPTCAGCTTAPVVYRDRTGGDQHGVNLPLNDPSQLLEFTFATVTPAPEPLKIDHGFVDYDISSVDQVYLPVAMDPVNNPHIGFIGSVLGRDQFNTRLGDFVKDFGWPKYKWPSYVTNQANVRLPATFNVMNEMAHPGAPPPFDTSGANLEKLAVVQAMHTLWETCCGTDWPAKASCTKPSTPPPDYGPTCDKMAQVADLFEKNYAHYTSLCATAAGLTRDTMLAKVYGWVPFVTCTQDGEPADVVNELKDTPGIGGPAGYHAISNAYVDLQYHSPPKPETGDLTFGDFNRYVQLIHDRKYLRVGEYAFSIDDAAGNMLEVGDGINITVGGADGLGNPNPYDPWRFFLFNLGSAPTAGPVWKTYRICTATDPAKCPTMAPDRDVKVADVRDGREQYAGIKIGAVSCPCVIVLQDSLGSLYKVLVKNLPAPPPVHPVSEEGDPPTAEDGLWTRKDGDTYTNASCFDTVTSFDWCRNLQPAKPFDPATQRTVYHLNTAAPVVPQPGIQFKPGDIVGTLTNAKGSVTVTWPQAITQPPNRRVTYELTLWNEPDCPPAGERCNGHASIPLAGTCNDASTQCRIILSKLVPPLTPQTLKSLSVIAKDSDGHIAAKQGNFTPQGPPPDDIRGGTATGVGLLPAEDGIGRGNVTISAVFTFSGTLNLAARGARVTVVDGLNEIGGAGELALDDPLTLIADERNTATTARFTTAAGTSPAAAVTIGSRGRGQYTLLIDVSRVTIGLPGGCPQPALTTSIEVDDGTNTPAVVDITEPWQCIRRGERVEYLSNP